MSRIKLSIMLLFIVPIVKAQDLNTLTKPQWLEDFDKLAYNIKARHTNPYQFMPKEQFNNKVVNLGYSLDELTLTEKLIELLEVASAPGDGKTMVDVEHYFNYFPIQLYWYTEGLRIEKIDPSMKEYAGMKVVAIDGMKINEAAATVQKLIPPNENLYYRLKWDQRWLRNADILYNKNITKSPLEATYTLEDESGNTKEVTFRAISFEELNAINWASAYSQDERFYQIYNKDFGSFAYDEFTIYLRMAKHPKEEVLKAETEKLVELLENHSFTHLVIDLRDNDTQESDAMDYLIKKIRRSYFHDHGVAFVVTGRENFGQVFEDIFELREDLDAQIVGEPPAQNPNGYEIGYRDVLPHSKIKYTIAGKSVELQEEETNTLTLQQFIMPNFKTRSERKDEVMEWIITQP